MLACRCPTKPLIRMILEFQLVSEAAGANGRLEACRATLYILLSQLIDYECVLTSH
jgi:hypothetical protein